MKILSFRALSLSFLKLGAVGFGGPIALVGLMQKEFCTHRKLISIGEFNEAYVLTKLFPGPLAAQMSAWIGYRLAGRVGAFVSCLSFILPAFVLILILTAVFSKFQQAWWLAPALLGMRIGALVIIVESVFKMFVPYRNKVAAWIIAICAAVALWIFPKGEPIIIVASGMGLVFANRLGWHPLLSISPVGILASLFWVHFKIAIFVFGTGLAIIPFLESETVQVWKWLTHEEFLNGLALGQVTPGPITITAAYVGYKVAGMLGALVATLGMFLPGILMVAFLMPVVQERVRKSSWAPAFSLGAISAVIGCLALTSFLLGRQTLSNSREYLFFVGLWSLTQWFRIPAWTVVFLGAVVSVILTNTWH